MPTYDYACKKCEEVFEVFHNMTATPEVTCEKCGSTDVEKQIGAGAGLVFKGSGFYETDYKKKPSPKESKKSTPKKKEDSSPKKSPDTGTKSN